MHLAWRLVVDMLLCGQASVRISRVMDAMHSVRHSRMHVLLRSGLSRVMAGTRPVSEVECSHVSTHVVSSCRVQGTTSTICSPCLRVGMGSIGGPRIGLTWSAAGRLTSLCLRVLAIRLHLLRVHRSGMGSLARDKVVVTLCALLCCRICATSGRLVDSKEVIHKIYSG